MADSFRSYRLSSYQEIIDLKQKIGAEQFTRNLYTIYKDLLNLDVGFFYPIYSTWNKIELIVKIKICCLFISEQYVEDYRFSEDYTFIAHY